MKINLDLLFISLIYHIRIFFFVILCTVIAGCGERNFPESGAPVANSSTKSHVEPTPEQKFLETLKLAEEGDPSAQFNIANAYLIGEGVQRDIVKAVNWIQKSAIQNNSDAQAKLAFMHTREGRDIYGSVLPEDYPKAIELYEKAIAQNNVYAQLRLGEIYFYGKDVPKDLRKGRELIERAASQGNSQAQVEIGKMYAKGEGVVRSDSNAVQWYKKAASQGHMQAEYELGRSYYYGRGVPQDSSIAASYYEKAALQGHPNAYFLIGYLYANGDGVPKDSVAAAKWLGKSASQGNPRAQAMLGSMYSEGAGVPKDDVLAYAWMNLAAGNGDTLAITIRDVFEKLLSNAEKAEAQRLTAKWRTTNGFRPINVTMERENSPQNNIGNSEPSDRKFSKTGTGTGFFVNVSGLLVTNHHVIQGCREVRLSGQEGVATLVTSDVVNDLALLKFPNAVKFSAVINSQPSKVSQGEDVIVFGFPLNSVLSSGGNLTPGVVSALTGLGNNTNQIQITAPIQPGSSGSPVINKKGEIIGVVSMKLSDSKMAQATGQVGQNVNFAVGGQTLKSFLDTHKVDYAGSAFLSLTKSNIELAEQAKKWTSVVECWK